MASFLHVSQEGSWFLKSSVSSMCQLSAVHQQGWNKVISCELLWGSADGRGMGFSHSPRMLGSRVGQPTTLISSCCNADHSHSWGLELNSAASCKALLNHLAVRRYMRVPSRAGNLNHCCREVFGCPWPWWEWDRAHSFPQQTMGCSGLPLYLRALYQPKCFHDSHATLCLLCSCSCKGKYGEAQFSSKLLHKENYSFLPGSLEWTEKYLIYWFTADGSLRAWIKLVRLIMLFLPF